MAKPSHNEQKAFDPEGSIFLPKTDSPESEFSRFYFELLQGRGIGKDRSPEELEELYEELQAMRQRYLGGVALT